MTALLKTSSIWFEGLGWDPFEINSVAIKIGKLEIAWYGLIIMTGMLTAVFYVWCRFRENKMKTDDLIDLAFFTIFSGIIGARLYYVIFEFSSYLETDGNFFEDLWGTFVNIIAIWEGGLAIYGGIIAGGVAALLVAKHKKMNILKILDFIAPAVMIAQAIGRWGNFCNAEAHGYETTLPWRMGILKGTQYNFYHPTFFYESMWNVIGFLAIWLVLVKLKKTKGLYKFYGQITYAYFAWYGLGRFWIEGLRTDSLYLVPDVIRISQVVALLCLIGGVALTVYSLIKLKKGEENLLVKAVASDTQAELSEKETKSEDKEKENGTNN